jgi:uncharacterized protein
MGFALARHLPVDRLGRLWPLRDTGVGRALGWFWLATLAGSGGLAVLLQMLGPPAAMPAPGGHGGVAEPQALTRGVSARTIAEPIAALREPASGLAGAFLPRIGSDGLRPMRAYAAPFDAADTRPRIGLLLAGMGLNGADSEAAIASLPGGVSLAFSPYAERPGKLLEAARARGHEFLAGLPMEPQGAPLHDAGNQALLLGATAEENLRRLDWSLSRIEGYVGATGAMGALRGERFAAADRPMRDVLQSLSGRGLLYVDPRPGASLPERAGTRAVDIVIDTAQQRAEIERRLHDLERIAQERGSAVGLAGVPLPMTIGAIAAWAAGLEERGFVLAPVSALVARPSAAASPAVAPRTEHAH